MSSATREIPHAAALPVPALGILRPEQIRGEACIWGGEPLAGGSAVDLGRRSGSLMGIVAPWEPKACADCMRAAVRRELPVHVGKCRLCGRGEACDTRRALRRLAWEDNR